MKNEVQVTCNDGTKFRIRYNKKFGEYVLEYRNDIKGVSDGRDYKVMNRWVKLDTQPMYCDALDFMFDEIKSIDAKEGE
jgi:hypothetical protein